MRLADPVKIALTYAEESSKRGRWIVFIMQLAVVLVIASVWAEDDSNWLQLRLNAAQSAVRLLECDPRNAYPSAKGYKPDDILHDQPRPASHLTEEDWDKEFLCTKALTATELSQGQKYLDQWHYSLAQAKKNVADLQQMMSNRVLGVTVPVLGIVFDINDLSLMAGVTFTILLSWFHFSLRRQHDNVKKVFELAEVADGPHPKTANSPSVLKIAYDLLSMSQVLTIPPGTSADSRNLSLKRRLLRLPNLIMWTAVIAQIVVVVDDLATMKHGDDLGVGVSHAETAIASCLLAYMVYRTIQCFRLMGETYFEWVTAYSKVYKDETKVSDSGKDSTGKLAWLVLLVVVGIHLMGERPAIWESIQSSLEAFFLPVGAILARICQLEERFYIWIIFPMLALLFWHCYVRPIRTVRLISFLFAGFISLHIVSHIITAFKANADAASVQHTMVSFYSLPLMLLATLNLVFLLKSTSPGQLSAPKGLGIGVGKSG